jgi:hypothetical protein
MEAASRADAALVHPHFGTNLCYRFALSTGDTEEV